MTDALVRRRPRIEVDENGGSCGLTSSTWQINSLGAVGFLLTEPPECRSNHDLFSPFDISPGIDQSRYPRTIHNVRHRVSETPHYSDSQSTNPRTTDKSSPEDRGPPLFESSFETLRSILQQRFYDDSFRWRGGALNLWDEDGSQSSNLLVSNKVRIVLSWLALPIAHDPLACTAGVPLNIHHSSVFASRQRVHADT